jgi:enoyl-CoA hydratase/carnithine racemase
MTESSPQVFAQPEPPVVVDRRGHVLLIGVNRPGKRNAWNLATIDAVG